MLIYGCTETDISDESCQHVRICYLILEALGLERCGCSGAKAYERNEKEQNSLEARGHQRNQDHSKD